MSPDVVAPAPVQVAGYELLVPIGRGGMGTVYLARREVVSGVRRHFAVKLLHPGLGADEVAAEELLREARLAALVQHPHVVAIAEAGTEPPWVYIAMDYVPGDTVATLIKESPRAGLPLPVVGRILVDALSGLHAAHVATDERGRPLGLVHRDFTPQNILVGEDGRARLTDFGIAKALEEVSLTATGIVKGKIAYMAPEQLTGGAIDARCDLWAAGVVAWEALTGRRLFKGGNDAARMYQILSGPSPAPPSSVRRDVPSEIDAAVMRALSRDPHERYADAEEMREVFLAGWGATGIADHDEVARLVSDLVADRLASREQTVRELSAARRRASGGTVEASMTDRGVDATAATRAVSSNATPAASANHGRWGLLLVALGGAAAVIAHVASDSGRAPAVLGRVGVPAIELDEVERAEHEPRTTLRVSANAAVAQLEVDGRTFPLAVPREDLSIPVADGKPVRVKAFTADRRVAEARVAATQDRVTLRFPARAVPRPRSPRPTDDVGARPKLMK